MLHDILFYLSTLSLLCSVYSGVPHSAAIYSPFFKWKCDRKLFFKQKKKKKLSETPRISCFVFCFYQAARVFEEVRRLEPYHIEGLDFYSSVLWHLHKEVELSLLAQELTAMDKKSPQAWFATGNCFSLQKEHDVAIKFFQRAIQVFSSCLSCCLLACSVGVTSRTCVSEFHHNWT